MVQEKESQCVRRKGMVVMFDGYNQLDEADKTRASELLTDCLKSNWKIMVTSTEQDVKPDIGGLLLNSFNIEVFLMLN